MACMTCLTGSTRLGLERNCPDGQEVEKWGKAMFMKVGSQWYEVHLPVMEARVNTLDPDKAQKALDNPRRFDPVHKNLNAKSIGSRRKPSVEKNIIANFTQALKPGVDKKAYDRAKVAWSRYKETMNSQFQGLVSKLEKGQLSKSQFLNQSRTLFKAGYEKAYRLGTDAGGLGAIQLPSEDLKWLARARSAEYKFLDKFADAIQTKTGTMLYSDRAKMYVDTVDSDLS